MGSQGKDTIPKEGKDLGVGGGGGGISWLPLRYYVRSMLKRFSQNDLKKKMCRFIDIYLEKLKEQLLGEMRRRLLCVRAGWPSLGNG